MARLMLSQISIKDNILDDEKYKYIFSVDAVNALVQKGMSFRDAYKKVGNDIDQGKFEAPPSSRAGYGVHEGSIGNLSNESIKDEMEKVLTKFS